MTFKRFLVAVAFSCTLGGVAQAASLVAPDLDASSPLAPAFDLGSSTSSAMTSPGAITFGLPSNETTTVSWINNGSTLLRDFNNNPLSQGVAGQNQDGMLVQLGYFSGGTTANNFAGDFIPLTLGTRIGDSFNLTGEGAGRIGFQTIFSLGSNVVDVFDGGDPGFYTTNSFFSISETLPAAGQVLAIRFFDTINGASGFYNTVSADTWLWQSPDVIPVTIDINFANGGLEWQDAANEFRTSIAIPEPSTGTLALLGSLLGLAARRRRKSGSR